MMRTKTPEQCFWEKVIKTQACWIWSGAKNKRGYGIITIRRKAINAHRFSYTIHRGQIPDRMFVCHHCDNPSCVRPDHLFLGTSKDNTQDMMRKCRDKLIGVRSSVHKLKENEVRFIRLYPNTYGSGRILAKQFGVCPETISMIKHGKSWKHIC